MASTGIHQCDDRCICPIHHTPMLYSRAQNEHACQDPNCQYAHGLETHLFRRWIEDRTDVAPSDSHSVIWAAIREALEEHDWSRCCGASGRYPVRCRRLRAHESPHVGLVAATAFIWLGTGLAISEQHVHFADEPEQIVEMNIYRPFPYCDACDQPAVFNESLGWVHMDHQGQPVSRLLGEELGTHEVTAHRWLREQEEKMDLYDHSGEVES